MRDIPIIFSAPMILALLEGRKTMTRRLAWKESKDDKIMRKAIAAGRCGLLTVPKPTPWQNVEVGDRLWVRENFHPWKGSASGKTICYVADGLWKDWGSGWQGKPKGYFATPMTSSMRMPRWASRLTLVVTAKKIERLQDIKEAGCIAEGCKVIQLDRNPVDDGPMVRLGPKHVYGTPRTWFRELWDSLHGAGLWDTNPEVVALSFTVHKQNIDSMKEAA